MRIAIITDNSPEDKKGAFMATHNRIKYLLAHKDLEVDVFSIQEYENWLTRRLRKTKRVKKEPFYKYDGITYKYLWKDFSIFNYILRSIFHKQSPFLIYSLYKWRKLFFSYDLLSAHSYVPGILAYMIHKENKIPYTITWHGSEIHTDPQKNNTILKWTKKLIKNATMNFFVSESLLLKSNEFIYSTNKQVLYNGVDPLIFNNQNRSKPKDDQSFNELSYHIAFIGSLLTVKNAELLPSIFETIFHHQSNIFFHVIGDGKLKTQIEVQCKQLNLPIRFYGNLSPEQMPHILHQLDLILLPSKNEGLPLVALEALACGVAVIGSRVGGITEIIGLNNTVPLNENFIPEFADLAIQKINNPTKIILANEFSWEKTAEKEYEFYKKSCRSRYHIKIS